MLQGTIKTLMLGKGFGFVTAGGEDYFVHYSEMINRDFDLLSPGSLVQFEGVPTGKGLRATKVRRL